MAKFAGSDDDGLVSLELNDDDKYDYAQSMPSMPGPDFPYGMKICLTTEELTKLGIDITDANIGDYFNIKAKACVTSISRNGTADEPCDRLEAQIEAMAIPDIEDDAEG